jgi:hypothetical protein
MRRRTVLRGAAGAAALGYLGALLARSAPAQSVPRSIPPPPPSVMPPAAPAAASAMLRLTPFYSAPFPYAGRGDDGRTPFFDVVEPRTRRRGHKGLAGEVLWESPTFRDDRVALYVPAGFDPAVPFAIVVFFHGHGTAIGRDIAGSLRLPAQIDAARANVVLVAPQFALDAADSSPGKFWQPNAFATFVDEAADKCATLLAERLPGGSTVATRRDASRRYGAAFNRAPVLLTAFSGGYKAAAWCLHHGGANHRLLGVLLLDALYGEEDKFARWLASAPPARRPFLISLTTTSTDASHAELRRELQQRRIAVADSWPQKPAPGDVAFVRVSTEHNRVVQDGPPSQPVRVLLQALAVQPPPKPAPPPPAKPPPAKAPAPKAPPSKATPSKTKARAKASAPRKK